MLVTVTCAYNPPTQPGESSPGGSIYIHKSYTSEKYESGATAYYIFEPDDPKPESAPVICFLHGYLAMDPYGYTGWILHLVKKGNVVVYPVYQTWDTSQRDIYNNAVTGLKNAINLLQTGEGHVRPEIGYDGLMNFAICGHSEGGNLTVAMASKYLENGIPKPKALMPVFYGYASANKYVWDYDYRNIPSDTFLLSCCGNDDSTSRMVRAEDVIRDTTQIDNDMKNYVIFMGDDYGDQDFVADHIAPGGTETGADALDFYGFWKLSTAVFNYAFYGIDRYYCLGGGEAMTDMGKWTDEDGSPVKDFKKLEVYDADEISKKESRKLFPPTT